MKELTELFKQGLFLLGRDTEMSMDDVKILRAYLAEGFYSFQQKNKYRRSEKSDHAWMLLQAEKMGVNVPRLNQKY